MARIVYPAAQPGPIGADLQPRWVPIVAYRGDDFEVNIALQSKNGEVVVIQGWTAQCNIRKGEEVHSAQITVNVDDFDFFVPAAKVALMVGVYTYDVEFTQLNGRVRTYMAGTFTVAEDVTP